jgi:hypothetical protein
LRVELAIVVVIKEIRAILQGVEHRCGDVHSHYYGQGKRLYETRRKSRKGVPFLLYVRHPEQIERGLSPELL